MEQPSSVEQSKKRPYRYCVVPNCRNTNVNAPDKVFFHLPRGEDIRRHWCEIMKREMLSPSSCLYCCEDHFDIEEDTYNFMEYKIMNLQGNHKITLRLKKGILPHKFKCNKATESKPPQVRKASINKRHLKMIKSALSAPPEVSISDSLSENCLKAGGGSSSSQIYIEETEIAYEAVRSASNEYSENKMHIGKTVQVDNKVNYRSIGVNVNLCPIKSTAVSSIPISSETTSLKIPQASGIEKKLSQDNADAASMFSGRPSLSSSFKPGINSVSSWVIENDSKETRFKIKCIILALKKTYFFFYLGQVCS